MEATRFRLFLVAGLWLGLAAVLALAGPVRAEDPPSQCVTCHLDAAKLKPLTPADPPSTEEGEG